MVLTRAEVQAELERSLHSGDTVNFSQDIFRITRDGLIELDAEILEYVLAKILVNNKVTVTLSSAFYRDEGRGNGGRYASSLAGTR